MEGEGGGDWHKASVSDCLPLAAPIGLSPLLILTLRGPERVLVVSTEPPDDLSCLTTPEGGGGGSSCGCQPFEYIPGGRHALCTGVCAVCPPAGHVGPGVQRLPVVVLGGTHRPPLPDTTASQRPLCRRARDALAPGAGGS